MTVRRDDMGMDMYYDDYDDRVSMKIEKSKEEFFHKEIYN
jgi:hypothetical protein